MLLSRTQVAAGMPDAAVESAERALRLAPDLWEAHTVVAGALRERGVQHERRRDLRRSLSEADQAVLMAPDVPDTHVQRGHTLLDLQRRRQAAAAYRDALRLDPNNKAARAGLGAVDAGSRRFFRAADTFAGVLRNNPHDDGAWRAFLATVAAGARFAAVLATVALFVSLRLLYSAHGTDPDAPNKPGEGLLPAAVVGIGLLVLAVYALRLWRSDRSHVVALLRHLRFVVAWLALVLVALLAALVLYLVAAPYMVVLTVVGPCYAVALILTFSTRGRLRRIVEGDPYVSPEAREQYTWEAERQRRRLRRTPAVLGFLVVLVAGLELYLQTQVPGYLPLWRWWVLGSGAAAVVLVGVPVMTKQALRLTHLRRLAR